MALILKLKCPDHPRYDPITGGQGAIRGACSRCAGLFELWMAYLTITRSRFGEDETEAPHHNS